jgi:purine-binding chemotaxis protein CheW
MELKIMQIIVFTLGDKYYALDTHNVKEISVNMDSSYIPKAPNWVEGLLNLRGNVIPLINLFKLLDLDGRLCYNNVIIVEFNQDDMGLMVSDVIKVVDISEEDIQDSSIILLDGKIINLLDIERLISEK